MERTIRLNRMSKTTSRWTSFTPAPPVQPKPESRARITSRPGTSIRPNMHAAKAEARTAAPKRDRMTANLVFARISARRTHSRLGESGGMTLFEVPGSCRGRPDVSPPGSRSR